MANCVFCGKPVSKSKRTMEHVLPKWLLEATGGLNREIRIGADLRTAKEWIRPASTFEFPACEPCNKSYGKGLETQARKIIGTLSEGGSISVANSYRLLDWLDKVRIGIWLGFLMLHREDDFTPKFSIDKRLGRKDRVAIIAADPRDSRKCLVFGGNENNLFRRSQCAIFLRINNIRIVSISADFLLARETGLPFGRDPYLVSGKPGLVGYNLAPGTYELSQDWSHFLGLGGTVLAQPIIDTRFCDPSWALNFYTNSRVLQHTKDTFRASGVKEFLTIIPLQLITNTQGRFRYHGNKRERIRIGNRAAHDDSRFMVHLYGLMLDRGLRGFPKDIRLPNGEVVAWLKGWQMYLDCFYQVRARLIDLGAPLPDAPELVEDIQRFDRMIEEQEAHGQGTCIVEEPLIDQFEAGFEDAGQRTKRGKKLERVRA